MKKLMIVMAVALAAVASQAAQIKWQMTATKADAAAGDGLQVYMILASAWDGTTPWESTDAIKNASVSDATFNVGAKSANTLATSYVSPDVKVGDTVDYYMVMVDEANSKYFASSKMTSTAAVADGINDKDPSTGALLPAGTAPNTIFNAGSNLKDPSKWTPAGAPEPTSAMLVLLGVAGLALKRRRA